MKDQLIKCPLTGDENSCYVMFINEKHKSYKSLSTGFTSNDLWVEGQFDFDKFTEGLPELYKVIYKVDSENRRWYPDTVNIPERGTVFILGTNSDDWEWASILSIPVNEEDKERFKNPKTGEYLTHKTDSSTLQTFTQFGFTEALESIGVLD